MRNLNIGLIVILMSSFVNLGCSSTTVMQDLSFKAKFVSMKEVPSGKKFRIIKKKKKVNFCPNLLKDDADKAQATEEDGGQANVTGFFDEAILKFQKKYRADGIYNAKLEHTRGSFNTKMCGSVTGYPVRFK